MDIGENERGEILTVKGWVDKDALTRISSLEDRVDAYVVSIEWRLGDELVRRDALPAPKAPLPTETNSLIHTIHGLLSVDELVRRLIYTESEFEFTIVREFTLIGSDVIVRRDAHVITKRMSEAASAVAGGLG